MTSILCMQTEHAGLALCVPFGNSCNTQPHYDDLYLYQDLCSDNNNPTVSEVGSGEEVSRRRRIS